MLVYDAALKIGAARDCDHHVAKVFPRA